MNDTTFERWRPVEGWPGYEVSDFGRVGSYLTKQGSKKGEPWAIGGTLKILSPGPSSRGHRIATLRRDGRSVGRLVHHLVLEAFVGPRPPGMQGCHNNNDPTDNRLSNLRWDTPSENQRDRVADGKCNFAKLTADRIPDIWGRLVDGQSCASIARHHGVSQPQIHAIKSGRCWLHITRKLPGYPLIIAGRPAGSPVFVPDCYVDTATEIWGTIPDYPAFRASNRGRVQNCLKRTTSHTRGAWFAMGDEWKDMKGHTCKDGHIRFFLRKDGKVRQFFAHQLVLLAFAGPCPPGMVGCHIDNNPANNDAGNLRWDTHKGNAGDRKKRGDLIHSA
jgi:hypothetical protein